MIVQLKFVPPLTSNISEIVQLNRDKHRPLDHWIHRFFGYTIYDIHGIMYGTVFQNIHEKLVIVSTVFNNVRPSSISIEMLYPYRDELVYDYIDVARSVTTQSEQYDDDYDDTGRDKDWYWVGKALTHPW